MNFNELFQKMRELDAPVSEELKGGQKELDTDKDGDIEADDLKDLRDKKVDEDLVDECGMGPMQGMNPGQQDNVNMSINMNGAGPGGIRDLLDILRNIEQGSDDPEGSDLGDLIGAMGGEPDGDDMHGKVAVIDGDEEMPVDEFANSPDEMYADVSDVTPTGNDIHSKGAEAEKVNGGGNPFGVDEEMINRLTNMYESIKNR
jgi:hypothetical protein